MRAKCAYLTYLYIPPHRPLLEALRDVAGIEAVGASPVPRWLRDIFLGYGDKCADLYSDESGNIKAFDFGDAILDDAHTPVCLGSSA